MNSAIKRVVAFPLISLLLAGPVLAQSDGARPSWRSAEDTPEKMELPPEVERPEMEFNVGREAFERPTFDAKPLAPTATMAPSASPELGRLGTWRERRAAALASEQEQEAVAHEQMPEPVAEPVEPEVPVVTNPVVETTDSIAALTPAPAPVLDLESEAVDVEGDPAPRRASLRPVSRVTPDYPRQAYLDRDEGWVDIEFEVAPDGEVRSVRVVAAEPRRTFEKAALRAASDWRFTPADSAEARFGVYRFEFTMDG